MVRMAAMALVLLSASFLGGCGSVITSSGVQKMGADTYSVMISSFHTRMPEAKRAAYGEAQAECDKQGKEVLIVKEDMNTVSPVDKAIDLTFKCIGKEDLSTTPKQEQETPVADQGK